MSNLGGIEPSREGATTTDDGPVLLDSFRVGCALNSRKCLTTPPTDFARLDDQEGLFARLFRVCDVILECAPVDVRAIHYWTTE